LVHIANQCVEGILKTTSYERRIGGHIVANNNGTTQREKFEQVARDAECDEDEARWDERLRKIAKQKPVEDKPVRP
jgi:hypothetical protein